MARVQYGGGVTAFRGSIAGNTFQRNTSGEIVRNRASRAKATTPLMSTIQARTFYLLSTWGSLTASQQLAWNTFAGLHPRTNFFGQEKTLSGFNFYVAINSGLILQGFDITDTPPAFTLPAALTAIVPAVDLTTLSIEVELPGGQSDTQLIIYTTPPIKRTTLNFRQQLRLTYVAPISDPDDLDITANWETTHGIPYPPSSPFNIRIGFACTTILETTGLQQPALFGLG